MNIVKQTNLSREGNDCWIDESVALCEEFGLYFVLVTRKVSGWSDYQDVTIASDITDSMREAMKTYKKCGGKKNEAVDR